MVLQTMIGLYFSLTSSLLVSSFPLLSSITSTLGFFVSVRHFTNAHAFFVFAFSIFLQFPVSSVLSMPFLRL